MGTQSESRRGQSHFSGAVLEGGRCHARQINNHDLLLLQRLCKGRKVIKFQKDLLSVRQRKKSRGARRSGSKLYPLRMKRVRCSSQTSREMVSSFFFQQKNQIGIRWTVAYNTLFSTIFTYQGICYLHNKAEFLLDARKLPESMW